MLFSGFNLYGGGFQGCLNVLSTLLKFPLLPQFTCNGDLLTAEEIKLRIYENGDDLLSYKFFHIVEELRRLLPSFLLVATLHCTCPPYLNWLRVCTQLCSQSLNSFLLLSIIKRRKVQDCCDKRLSRAPKLGLKTLTRTHSPRERSRCDLRLLRAGLN